jgi:hypothetical protein
MAAIISVGGAGFQIRTSFPLPLRFIARSLTIIGIKGPLP